MNGELYRHNTPLFDQSLIGRQKKIIRTSPINRYLLFRGIIKKKKAPLKRRAMQVVIHHWQPATGDFFNAPAPLPALLSKPSVESQTAQEHNQQTVV
jgi:hypothetical protein